MKTQPKEKTNYQFKFYFVLIQLTDSINFSFTRIERQQMRVSKQTNKQ